jgi:FdhE protein
VTATPLEKLAAAHPEMRRAADVVAALGRAAADGERALAAAPAVALDDAVLEARLAAGIPALRGEAALLDGRALLDGVRRVADALGAVGEPAAGAARAVVAALEGAGRAGVDLDALAVCALAGEWDDARAAATRLDVDDDALVTLLDHAARPALRRAAAAGRPALARSRAWSRGTCPMCGAPPLLAELRGKERMRTLRCGRCAVAWEFARVACPACGERDHHKLSALHGEGEADFRRADCCDTCRVYVKAVATLDPLSPDALLETDLATAALDWAAAERGYHR